MMVHSFKRSSRNVFTSNGFYVSSGSHQQPPASSICPPSTCFFTRSNRSGYCTRIHSKIYGCDAVNEKPGTCSACTYALVSVTLHLFSVYLIIYYTIEIRVQLQVFGGVELKIENVRDGFDGEVWCHS
ncbi:MAG: hypothetical protein ACTSUE_26840 [Promethearchaeota archaeon]